MKREVIDISKTEYAMYSPTAWALKWIEMHGDIEGDQQKAWLLDQIARILNYTKVVIEKLTFRPDMPPEYIFSLDEPAEQYHRWVANLGDPDYDTGVAP